MVDPLPTFCAPCDRRRRVVTTKPSRLPKWLLGGGSIAVAMGIMNVGTYGFTMLAARLLGPQPYGALASLMATLLVISVLQLGLQATAARRLSDDPGHVRQIEGTTRTEENTSDIP